MGTRCGDSECECGPMMMPARIPKKTKIAIGVPLTEREESVMVNEEAIEEANAWANLWSEASDPQCGRPIGFRCQPPCNCLESSSFYDGGAL